MTLASDGWQAFDYDDLMDVLCGSDRLRGYYNFSRTRSLSSYGLSHPTPNVYNFDDYDVYQNPSEFLELFNNKRLETYRSLRMVLWHPDHGYATSPVIVRGMDTYRKRVESRLEKLHDYMQYNKLDAVFVTISPRSGVGKSPLDSLLEMRDMLNPLMSFVQSQLGYRPHYLWAVEPTKRGHCHYHILFIGVSRLFDKSILDNWFINRGLGNGAGIYMTSFRHGKKHQAKNLYALLNYLIEYISKPTHDAKWSGLLALTRKREWGMSQRLAHILSSWTPPKDEGSLGNTERLTQKETSENDEIEPLEWLFIGVLSEFEIEYLITDRPKPPDPDDLIRDIQEIRGALHSSFKSHDY
jgi:hypothetical protein